MSLYAKRRKGLQNLHGAISLPEAKQTHDSNTYIVDILSYKRLCWPCVSEYCALLLVTCIKKLKILLISQRNFQ